MRQPAEWPESVDRDLVDQDDRALTKQTRGSDPWGQEAALEPSTISTPGTSPPVVVPSDPRATRAPRIIACGSRGWHDRQRIADWLADYVIRTNTVPKIIVGYNPEKETPKGADRLVYQEAQKLGHLIETHPAKWDEHGKAAGFIRNEDMAVGGAVLCVAFWDGRSTGTRDMMDRARRHGIPVEEVIA